MRYAESTDGEDSIVFGEFPTGSTVTCTLYNASSDAVITVGSNACSEIATTGVFKYLLSNITTKPTSFTQILYIMSDAATGRTRKGKVIVGEYPTANVADAVWDEVRSGHLGAGTAGEAQDRIDATVSSRATDAGVASTLAGTHGAGSWATATGFAVAGDAMDLVTDAVDAAAVAASGAAEIAAAVVVTPGPTAAVIADAVWDETTSGHTTTGTFGLLFSKLLTVAKFLGLK